MQISKILPIYTTKQGIQAFKVNRLTTKKQIVGMLKVIGINNPNIRTCICKKTMKKSSKKKVFKKVFLLNNKDQS